MPENEQTPTAGEASTPPASEQSPTQPAGASEPGAAGQEQDAEGAPDGAAPGGAPGQGGARRRRRRRGRRGRGNLPGAPGQPGGAQASGPNGAAPQGAAPPPQAQAQPEQTEEVEGVLQFEGKGLGWLRDPKRSYLGQPFDVEVPRWLVERMHLQPGLLVKGLATVRNMKRVLSRVDQVEGTDPVAVARRTHFQNLTATDPTEKLLMETRADEMVGRVLDLIAPIGLGRARPHHLSAQGRQDDHAAADRPGHHRQPAGRAPHGAARGRAPRGAHRHAPQRAGRGHRLVQRPPGRGAHPRRRDGRWSAPSGWWRAARTW